MGMGGSIFVWHPERKISISYVPAFLEESSRNEIGKILELFKKYTI